jgi:hypothetical protein
VGKALFFGFEKLLRQGLMFGFPCAHLDQFVSYLPALSGAI